MPFLKKTVSQYKPFLSTVGPTKEWLLNIVEVYMQCLKKILHASQPWLRPILPRGDTMFGKTKMGIAPTTWPHLAGADRLNF